MLFPPTSSFSAFKRRSQNVGESSETRRGNISRGSTGDGICPQNNDGTDARTCTHTALGPHCGPEGCHGTRHRIQRQVGRELIIIPTRQVRKRRKAREAKQPCPRSQGTSLSLCPACTHTHACAHTHTHTHRQVSTEKAGLPGEPLEEAGAWGAPAQHLHSDRVTEAVGLKIKPLPPATPVCSTPAARGPAKLSGPRGKERPRSQENR